MPRIASINKINELGQQLSDLLGQFKKRQGRAAFSLVVGRDPDLLPGLEGVGGHAGKDAPGFDVLVDQLVEWLIALLGGLVEEAAMQVPAHDERPRRVAVERPERRLLAFDLGHAVVQADAVAYA